MTSSPWRSRIVGSGEKPASDFLAHPDNWRIHPKPQQDALAGVLSEVGWVQQVVENVRTGHLIDGHLRIGLALSQGDDTPVPYVQVDLSEEEERLVLATLDPLSAMAATDAPKLEELLREVQTGDAAVQAMLAELAEQSGFDYGAEPEPAADPGAQVDRAEELRAKWGVEKSQLWKLGRHRLLCGDSYSEPDIARLMNGQRPDLLHTDPPYGINIVSVKTGLGTVGGSKPFGSTSGSNRKSSTGFDSARLGTGLDGPKSRNQIIQSNLYPIIQGDDRPFDPAPLLGFAPIVILWGANYYADRLPISSCWICWDKREDITRNNFADCELAWCSAEKPARVFHHLWNGLHKGSQQGERRTHPTEKPVALFEEIGKFYADGGLWVDLFAGTGAQIVAAERSGARCFACETEPLYVATTIERMAGMGLEPRLSDA